MPGKHFRIIVLGAGFSAPAGLPLGPSLFQEVRERAAALPGHNWLERDLEIFLDFKRVCERPPCAAESVDFEEFLAFLDVEHYLGFRGGDTWSEEGNESQVLIKRLIGKILHERTPRTRTIPEFYLRFAEALDVSDIVVTFNYDVLLERCLEAVGKPYRLFPNRYERIGLVANVIDSSIEEVTVLKVHGSVDWFDRSSYEDQERIHAGYGHPGKPRHPIFENLARFEASPLVDGPRDPKDPLNKIYRIAKLDEFYSNPRPPAVPMILTPSSMKLLYAQPLRDFWFGFGSAGSLNFGVAVIGFSMPLHDQYARQAIFSLVRNFQNVHRDLELAGIRKGRLKMVDLRRTMQEQRDFRERYRFVNWEDADLKLNGFDGDAVAMIFDDGL